MKHGVVKKVEVVTKKRGTIYLRLPEGRWTIPDGWIIPYGNDPNEFRIELSRNEKFELINLNLSDYELRKKWYN